MPNHIITTQQITYAEAISLINTSALMPGAVYKIKDRGDRGLFFHALGPNKLSKKGIRQMLCPAWYGTGVRNGNNWIGVWNDRKEAAVGTLTIWGGKVWKNLTGEIGAKVDDLSLDNVNWLLISKEDFENGEYVEMEFGVSYDIANDWIEQQWDAAGNVIGLDFISYQWMDGTEGGNYCDTSDWNYAANDDGNVFFGNIITVMRNNSCGSIYFNRCPYGINNNSNVGEISGNSNAGRINNNSNSGDINNNSNIGDISGNSNSGRINNNSNNGAIIDNSNNGEIYNSRNNGDVYNNSNVGPINNNSNVGLIYNNSNVGLIYNNSNVGPINNNSNVGEISGNSNAGRINNNSNSGDINNNSNNGNIETISASTTSIVKNTNNGHITTTIEGGIADPEVNK